LLDAVSRKRFDTFFSFDGHFVSEVSYYCLLRHRSLRRAWAGFRLNASSFFKLLSPGGLFAIVLLYLEVP